MIGTIVLNNNDFKYYSPQIQLCYYYYHYYYYNNNNQTLAAPRKAARVNIKLNQNYNILLVSFLS